MSTCLLLVSKKPIRFITSISKLSAKDLFEKEPRERLVYSDLIRRKQAEALSWQINKKGDDDDGGFCAEKPNDVGGVWTTAETLSVMLKYKLLTIQDSRMQRAKDWLAPPSKPGRRLRLWLAAD